MPRHYTPIGIGLILLLAFATAYATGLHIIDLKNRPADEILPVIRPLVSAGGSISGQGFRLFVRTSGHNFANIRQAVAKLDVPEQMLHISVRQSRSLVGLERMRRTDGMPGVIVRGRAQHGSGHAPGDSYRIERQTSGDLDHTTRSLSVLDGHRAFIQIGRSYPQVQPFVALAGSRLDIGAGIEYRDVATGFEVLPRLHGSRVWIEITPRFSFMGNRGGQTVDFHRLHTTIEARIGQWVDLGGAVGATNDITRNILGRTIATGSERRQILIRIDK
ncbi:MAG: hypothetical protein ACYDB8_06440 [Acidiferrobacterales bacterium]